MLFFAIVLFACIFWKVLSAASSIFCSIFLILLLLIFCNLDFFAQNFSNYLFMGLEAWTLVSKRQVSSHGVVLYGLGQSILVVLAFWWPFALFGPRSWSLNRSGHCNETLCQDLDWIHLPLFDWRRKILFILCIP